MHLNRIRRRLQQAGYTPDEAAEIVVKTAIVLIAAVQTPVTILGTVGLIELLR